MLAAFATESGKALTAADWSCDWLCRSYHHSIGGRRRALYGRIVARIYLNRKDLKLDSADLTSHEAGHAAVAWARFVGADLTTEEGEETMCYALGRLVHQITRCLYAEHVFD